MSMPAAGRKRTKAAAGSAVSMRQPCPTCGLPLGRLGLDCLPYTSSEWLEKHRWYHPRCHPLIVEAIRQAFEAEQDLEDVSREM